MSHRHVRTQLEILERRCLLVANLNGTVLEITGDDQDNSITVEIAGDNIQVTEETGTPMTFARAGVTSLRIRTLAGDDEVDIDSAVTVAADIECGAGDDLVFGGAGNDSIEGGPGSDDLDGGPGDDQISGESPRATGTDARTVDFGADTIFGGAGNDNLGGQEGDDELDGGAGNDTIRGRQGSDSIDGGDGNDNVRGGFDSDTIDGGVGDDLLVGRGGGDSILGGAGSDTIGDDNQVENLQSNLFGQTPLRFGAASDTLDGGDGADVLLGGEGTDRLVGGAGADVFGPGNPTNVMVDLSATEDVNATATPTFGSHTDTGLRGVVQPVSGDSEHFTYGLEETHPFTYSTTPPTSGPHFITPFPTGIYTTLPGPSVGQDPFTADERIVHNLEHGHVVVWYDPTRVTGPRLTALQLLVQPFVSRAVLAARTNNPAEVTLTSWGRLQTTHSDTNQPLTANDLDQVRAFLVANRGKGPEQF